MAHSLTIFFQVTVGSRDKELSHISLSNKTQCNWFLDCTNFGSTLWEENKGLQIIHMEPKWIWISVCRQIRNYIQFYSKDESK